MMFVKRLRSNILFPHGFALSMKWLHGVHNRTFFVWALYSGEEEYGDNTNVLMSSVSEIFTYRCKSNNRIKFQFVLSRQRKNVQI